MAVGAWVGAVGVEYSDELITTDVSTVRWRFLALSSAYLLRQ